ncbi:MAG: mg2+ transporter (MgtE) [Candidatus Hecatellales archaeon B24]|nr:MAG: mg2+ transporter (MgtE) [Candidatus Hecatellales archaeon B24]
MTVENVKTRLEAEEIIERIEADEDLRLLVSKIDIPYILERIPREDRGRLIRLLPDEVAGRILPKLPSEILESVVVEIERERLIKIATSLPADELSDLFNKLPFHWKKKLSKWLPTWKLNEVKPLLAYPPDTAGGLMTNRIPIFFEGLEVDKVIKEFTVRLKFDEYDTSHYIYAVDSDEKLKGVISSKELLLSPRDKKLRDVVASPLAVVKPGTDQEEAARIVARYDLIELPVVDDKGKLLGAITVDDVIDVIVKESGEDLLKLAATVKVTAPYLAAKITDLVKKRVLWLIMLCLVEVVVAFIISSFEKVISATIALAFFIPLISSTGGNSGVQTSTLVIRGLAVGELSLRDLLRILVKESMVSTLLGLVISPFLFALSFAVTFQLWVSIILALAIIIIIFVVNLMGGIMPLFVAKIGIDPATISAPLVTTVADAIGLTIYFLVAVLVLG